MLVASLAVGVHLLFVKNLNHQWDGAPLHQWYESQKDEKGGSCCGQADAEWYTGNYALNSDGSAVLYFGKGKREKVPAWKVLKGPNPTGHAIWWHGEHTYCFIAGPGL